MWSEGARAVWGKTDPDSGDWLPLVQHLEDARLVAGHLWDTWLPGMVRDRVADAAGGLENGRALLTWLAGIHDVGKATPAFATQAYERPGLDHVLRPLEEVGMSFVRLPPSRRRPFHHTVTGEVAVEAWLAGRHGWSRRTAWQVGGIVGGHHGLPLTNAALAAGRTEYERTSSALFGDERWEQVRVEILDGMARRCGVGDTLTVLAGRALPLTVQMDLTGAVIMADWIASDARTFPYDVTPSSDARWKSAAEQIRLTGPWTPSPDVLDDTVEALLARRVPRLSGLAPHPVQRAAVKAARSVSEPSLMIVEAPMGHGKTEAALLAAEVLAHRFGAGGVFVGLPTMATSDAMFARVLDWLDTDAQPGASVHLAHSKAGLNERYRGLLSESFRARGIYDAEESDEGHTAPVVDLWTTGRKKGLLASVVVGTIDQALIAGLQTRHLGLRHLAIDSKVVILDEVHAADDYMRSYLCRVLEWLGRYGTPVILLSATLPSPQRAELAAAYARGRDAHDLAMSANRGYPAITMITADTADVIEAPGSNASLDLHLEQISSDPHDIARAAVDETTDGGCLAVICNTVSRAQTVYEHVSAQLPTDEVVLLHSRFLGPHRMAREERLREELGPPAPDRARPGRRIVVGTQVLEQSLDIDVDVMITDLAPMDLILQRAGRLHRHARLAGARPARVSQPRLLLATTSEQGQLSADRTPEFERGSRAVYGAYRLLRAAECLLRQAESPVRLPHDIPRLVDRAYSDDVEPPASWADLWRTSRARHQAQTEAAVERSHAFQLAAVDSRLSMVGLLDAAVPSESEDAHRLGRATVRDTEDGLEVLVAIRGEDGLLRLPAGVPLGGSVLPAPITDDRVARALAACTVRLPLALTNARVIDDVIGELEQEPAAISLSANRHLRGQLLLVLDSEGNGRLQGHHIRYDDTLGLTVQRAEGDET